MQRDVRMPSQNSQIRMYIDFIFIYNMYSTGSKFMKKAVLLFLVLIGFSSINAQVMNTGQLLSPGKFGLSFAPCFYGPGNYISLDINTGYGLTRSVDLNLNFNLGHGNYFGADVEWRLLGGTPALSLTTGAHTGGFDDIGFDATLNLTFRIASAYIYTGMDADINIHDSGTDIPVWFFIGPEIPFRRNLSFIMEADIGINDALSMLALGLGIYF